MSNHIETGVSRTILTRTIDGVTFSFANEGDFDLVYNEKFKVNQYKFSTRTTAPLILDCGANIGISVLYFKKLYPRARVIAFEPNPETFKLLEHNVQQNNLCDVQLINAAVGSSNGTIEFYVNDDPVCWSLSDTGIADSYSGPAGWKAITVPQVRLSSYITEPVDYLKLDIEGMEEIVLREIEERIDLIGEIRMEFHSHRANKENDLDRVLSLLARHEFNYAFELDRKLLSLRHVRRAIQNNEKYLFIIYLHRKRSRVWWQSHVVPKVVRVQNRLPGKV
jgi:FkbM family methyltransferase